MSHLPSPTRLVHATDSPLSPVLASLERVAQSRAPALLTGESGTGKGLIARHIHNLSPWRDRPMVTVSCGGIAAPLLERALFGHAQAPQEPGLLARAADGTLLLDDIDQAPPSLQTKLVHVIRDRVYLPLGATTPVPTDARIVAATHTDVNRAVCDGLLRESLFFHLDVVRLHLPPLRERRMDIAPLARHFIERHAATHRSLVQDLTDVALVELQRHAWPGNVRELENVIQGILVLKERGAIDADDVCQKLAGRAGRAELPEPHPLYTFPRLALPDEGIPLKDTLERLERELIREALNRCNGNRARAATLLGLNRTTLVEKLKRMSDDEPLPLGRFAGLSEAGSSQLM